MIHGKDRAFRFNQVHINDRWNKAMPSLVIPFDDMTLGGCRVILGNTRYQVMMDGWIGTNQAKLGSNHWSKSHLFLGLHCHHLAAQDG